MADEQIANVVINNNRKPILHLLLLVKMRLKNLMKLNLYIPPLYPVRNTIHPLYHL